ncbi:response regulator transcription factor [Paenibacillus athensensis]|uniref:Uncharacterized protein n=1 Tax=Paenibacillus athensensis TaxID=1967502 RepID=A0A4Y8PW50_9BACL|nr:response regulator transcription factor [Paenibacillus athensensis]MCD1258172.1 response regulator transcription factor [Paenibacillus athensensis]
MNRKVTIVVVDDHPLMAEATSFTLRQLEGVEVAGIADNGAHGLALVERYRPDIVFLDFHLPDQYGDEIAKIIKSRYPAIHLVIFTGIEFTHLYNHLIGLEVSAVISKESKGVLIQSLITILMENHTIVPLPVFHNMRVESDNLLQTDVLDEQDMHMMSMILEGLTNEQMAERMHMSKRTVDNYVRKIYEKIGVKSRGQAVDKFMQYKHIYEAQRRD